MVTRMPTVWMVDPAGAKRGTITYTQLKAIPRYCDVGTWRVECKLTERAVQAAAAGWRVLIDDESGIYGGYVTEAEIALNDRVPRLTLSGMDDMIWLRYSLAWPLPTAAIGSQSVAYDVRTGTASTVLTAYVAANRGPLATNTSRRIPGFTLSADPLIGATVTGRARFTQLLELLQGLAITGGVGFRMRPTGIDRNMVFEVYSPPSLGGVARFGLGLNNLQSLKWRITAPTATAVVGGGRGEETARDFVELTDAAELAAWGRLEGFFDYRSASDSDALAELTQGTQRKLDESGATQFVEIQPVDTPRLAFGTGYQLGSEVKVDVYNGITLSAIIREVEITVERSGGNRVRTVKPRVGDIGATATSRQMVALRDAVARVANLETNR